MGGPAVEGGDMLARIASVLLVCASGTPAQAETLILANGDRLTGEIVAWEVDSVVLDHPQLGKVELALDQLRLDTGDPPNPGLLGTDFLRGWTRSLDVGANGKDGNTENQNMTLGLDMEYTDDFKRWLVRARYFFASEDGATTDSNGRFEARRDWLLPDNRWFWRAGGRYQFDKFESWKQRFILLAGPGYHLIEGEAHDLDGLVGVAFTREEGERDNDKGEGVLGFDYVWTVSEQISFRLSNQVFTELAPDAGNVRNTTTSEARWALTKEPALSLKLGFENEYETEVERGDEKNDLYYYLSLGLGF
jgi:putative salt-induced outer membrane protein YdiY